jgi:hypothetical protein
MTFERYTAKVNGLAWAGYKASTEYEFPHLPTRADVLARSGDFQHVTRVSVTRTTTTIERVRVK